MAGRRAGLRRRCTRGRSTTSTASGARAPSGLGVRWHDAAVGGAGPRARCRARSGSPGGTLNYAEHALAAGRPGRRRRRRRSSPQRGRRRAASVTWAELRRRGRPVPRRAAAARRAGAATGSPRYCPTSPRRWSRSSPPRSLGAVWSSCAPDFGTRAVLDRFAQIEPTVLLAVDGYRYGDKVVRHARRRRGHRGRAADRCGTTVLVPYLDPDATLDGTLTWADAHRRGRRRSSSSRCRSTTRCGCSTRSGHHRAAEGRSCTATAASPSSTSRRCALHHDLGAGDRFFWFTTTGWMMWNYLVVRAAGRARRSCCFDGSPAPPRPRRAVGSSPPTPASTSSASSRAVPACRAARRGCAPARPRPVRAARRRVHRLAAAARRFRWVARRRRRARADRSVSGGTDVCAAFLGARAAAAGAGWASSRCRRSASRSRRSTTTGRRARSRRAGRARRHRADAVDAGRLLGRPRRAAAARGVLRRLPGRVAARRLDRAHRRAARA